MTKNKPKVRGTYTYRGIDYPVYGTNDHLIIVGIPNGWDLSKYEKRLYDSLELEGPAKGWFISLRYIKLLPETVELRNA